MYKISGKPLTWNMIKLFIRHNSAKESNTSSHKRAQNTIVAFLYQIKNGDH